jgi:tetratricopeptide (TPR) repeat protein
MNKNTTHHMNKKPTILQRKTWKEHFDAGMRYRAASDLARAESSFRKAVRLAPDEPDPHYGLGLTLFAGRYGEALSELRRTNELARGFSLVQQELSLCEQVISGHLSQRGLQRLREFQSLANSGDTSSAQARRLARQAIEAAPQCAIAHFYLGQTLLLGDDAGAETALRRCLELDPDDTTAIEAKIYLGALRERAGKTDEALCLWRGVLADYPGNPHMQIWRDLSRGTRRRLERSHRRKEKATAAALPT